MEILTPFGDYCVLLNMVGFVDNSTTITGSNKTDTVQDLSKKNTRRCATLVQFIMVFRKEPRALKVWFPLYSLLSSV